MGQSLPHSTYTWPVETNDLPLFPAATTPPGPAPQAELVPGAKHEQKSARKASKKTPAKPDTAPTPAPRAELDAIIVGAGLAGLNCARELAAGGKRIVLLDAADAPGGRIRTDTVDGFRLDRGFQVLLTEYPEAKRVLDYDALNLKTFLPGALVRQGGSFHRFADPFREFRKAISFAFDSVVPFGDKLRIRRLRNDCLRQTDGDLFNQPEETTREFLRRGGFSPMIQERFFAPFFGGIFLERNLTTSARWFRWLFRIFATGLAAVPALGMEEIPRQLAASLAPDIVRLNAPVTAMEKTPLGWRVTAGDAGSFEATQLVMAAREPEARTLLATVRPAGPAPARTWNRTTTFYYAATEAPVDEPVVVLNGDGPNSGPVNHLAVMSLVSPAYAPPGAHLICANVVGLAPETDPGMAALEADVRAQLRRWFGSQVNRWNVVGGYPIAHALPMQLSLQAARKAPTDSGIVLSGDYLTSASIQGALTSGARASAAVLATEK